MNTQISTGLPVYFLQDHTALRISHNEKCMQQEWWQRWRQGQGHLASDWPLHPPCWSQRVMEGWLLSIMNVILKMWKSSGSGALPGFSTYGVTRGCQEGRDQGVENSTGNNNSIKNWLRKHQAWRSGSYAALWSLMQMIPRDAQALYWTGLQNGEKSSKTSVEKFHI